MSEWLKGNYRSEVLVQVSACMLAVLLVPVMQLVNCECEFRRGLGIQTWSPFPLCIPIELGVVPVSYMCLLVLGNSLLRKRGRRIVTVRTLVVGVLVFALAVVWFFHLLNTSPPLRQYLRGYRQWAQSTFTPAEFAGWRDDLLRLKSTGQPFRDIVGAERPPFLKKISAREGGMAPYTIAYFDDLGRPRHVVVACGGGFLRWGFFVCLAGGPPRDSHFDYLPVFDNVYVFTGD